MKNLLPKTDNDPLFQGIVKANPEAVKKALQPIGQDKPSYNPREKSHLLGLNDIIDHNLDEPGRDQIKDCGERGAGKRRENERAVGTEVTENTEKKCH